MKVRFLFKINETLYSVTKLYWGGDGYEVKRPSFGVYWLTVGGWGVCVFVGF